MYNNSYYLDKLMRSKDEIENMIKMYQNQPNPVNNYINTNVTPSKDLIEWRVLNENEEVDNLYVSTKTLFVGDENMVLKGVDGSLEKWKITKTYPIDKKDEKINQLEEEIKKLKEMIKDEPTKPNITNGERNQSVSIDDEHFNTKSKTNGKPISK